MRAVAEPVDSLVRGCATPPAGVRQPSRFLEDVVDKSSCIPREPLSKLDENGSAPILNDNLPQSTTDEVVSFIQLDIPGMCFDKAELEGAPHAACRWDT
jgi:hypothetical protein